MGLPSSQTQVGTWERGKKGEVPCPPTWFPAAMLSLDQPGSHTTTEGAYTTNYPARTEHQLSCAWENRMQGAELLSSEAGHRNHSEAVDQVPSEIRKRQHRFEQPKELGPNHCDLGQIT